MSVNNNIKSHLNFFNASPPNICKYCKSKKDFIVHESRIVCPDCYKHHSSFVYCRHCGDVLGHVDTTIDNHDYLHISCIKCPKEEQE